MLVEKMFVFLELNIDEQLKTASKKNEIKPIFLLFYHYPFGYTSLNMKNIPIYFEK